MTFANGAWRSAEGATADDLAWVEISFQSPRDAIADPIRGSQPYQSPFDPPPAAAMVARPPKERIV